MKTSNESSQQDRKIEKPIFQPATQMRLTYPLGTTDADIDRSVRYYADVANANLANTANGLRVSLGNVTISPKEKAIEVTIAGSHVNLFGDIFMKGGTPNPPPNPPQPIIPPDSLVYGNVQLQRTFQGTALAYQSMTLK